MSLDSVVGLPDTVGVTVWEALPSLVTVTFMLAGWPAFMVAFRLVLSSSSVLPCGCCC